MTHLIIFHGDADLPSHSPFCVKAMCLMEMAGHDWQPEYIQDLSTMPLGRVPVLRLGDRLIPDSHHIQEYLEALGTDFYAGLTDIERAASHALVRMTEESLRLGLVHDRWLDETCWPLMRETFFAGVPAPARDEVAAGVQTLVRHGLMGNGIAQFTPQDRTRRLTKDLAVLAAKLADKDFMFGDSPTAADAAIGPVLDMILRLPAPTGLRLAAESHPAFAPYVARVRAALYPPMKRFATATAAA